MNLFPTPTIFLLVKNFWRLEINRRPYLGFCFETQQTVVAANADSAASAASAANAANVADAANAANASEIAAAFLNRFPNSSSKETKLN